MGIVAIGVIVLLTLWGIGEVVFLSGDKVYDDYLQYNQPLAITAVEEGERFRVVIQSRTKEKKRKLTYSVTGPQGLPVIDDHDSWTKQTRAFYFKAPDPGTYRLTMTDYYSPGGSPSGGASPYIDSMNVKVYSGDRSKLLGIVENFVVLW